MSKIRRIAGVLATAGLLLLPLSVAGCSGEPAAQTAKVQAGDMPQGAEWTGVYYSELYGHLHLVQDGNSISGKWLRPTRDRWGEVHGSVVGDLLHFSWVEHTIGLATPNANKSGHGYFKYKRPPGDNVDDTLVGEIGRNADEVGEPWEAVKQRHQNPDLKSIGGTDATDVGGGDWDKGNKEQGNPEPPHQPSP